MRNNKNRIYCDIYNFAFRGIVANDILDLIDAWGDVEWNFKLQFL